MKQRIHYCIECGCCLGVVWDNHKYCADCAAVRQARQRRSWKRQRKPKPLDKMTLEDVVRAAMAEGISYGQYVLRHSMNPEPLLRAG